MECNVQKVSSNLRYSILNIKNNTYIVDLDRSFLAFFCPFLNWLLPQTIFTIEDKSIIDELKAPKVNHKVPVSYQILGGGISVIC